MLLQDTEDFESRHHMLMEEHKILVETAVSTHRETERIDIVAKSPEIRQQLSVESSVAPLDSTVLLYGESGNGKEVVTRYIHERSGRRDKPFIAVNCVAFQENLIEAELLGYEKGSFAGAKREGKAGLVEAADGGKINSLPLSVQGKALRMIEEKGAQRIGAIRAKEVDFRLIAATNRELSEMVQKGTFREDYRLHVIPLTQPSG